MSFINKYLRNFTPYSPASHKVWSVTSEERNGILKLDWNEATVAPSPNVEKRIKKLMEDCNFFNLYPETYNECLLSLLSQYVELPEPNIQYFASSDSLHEYIAKLYITVGDPILMVGPTYDNFRLTAEVCGGDIFKFDIDEHYFFDENNFITTLNKVEPSLVYLCNPNNPTGKQFDIEYINRLIESYPDTLFLIDEAYAEFSGITCKDLVLNHENILISRTMSKAFALANFRFGYLLASEKNINYISSIRNPKNITTFAQEAVIGALSDLDYMRSYVKEVNTAKLQFEEDLKTFSDWLVYSHGEGNFILLRCKESGQKERLFYFLSESNIFVRNLSQTEYLKKYCLRITIGTRKQMKQVIEILKGFDWIKNE